MPKLYQIQFGKKNKPNVEEFNLIMSIFYKKWWWLILHEEWDNWYGRNRRMCKRKVNTIQELYWFIANAQ